MSGSTEGPGCHQKKPRQCQRMGSKKVFEAELAGRFHIASVSECGLAVYFCVEEGKLLVWRSGPVKAPNP
jgi:hypothetical protein